MHLADVNRAFELMKSGRVARSLLDFESAKRSEPEGRESGGRAPSRRVEATGSPLRPRRNHAVASGRAALAPWLQANPANDPAPVLGKRLSP